MSDNRMARVDATLRHGVHTGTCNQCAPTDGLREYSVGCCCVSRRPRKPANTHARHQLPWMVANEKLGSTRKPSPYAKDVRDQVTNRGYTPRVVTADKSATSNVVGESCHDAETRGLLFH